MKKRNKGRQNFFKNDRFYIDLGNGKYAICDKDRFNIVNRFNWCLSASGYVKTTINGKSVFLHRFLCPEIKSIDHINGNPLDNRSQNIRPATHQENMFNRRKNKTNKTGFKGVTQSGQKFVAMIGFNGKVIYLGTFENKIEAARAYDKKALELHGEFANINFSYLS